MAEAPWIVVPCYNEAERLDPDAFEAATRRPGGAANFVFVNDGSTDGTGDVLAALGARASDRCRVLTLSRNRGKAEAVRAGLRSALETGAERVGYWDADLATPLDVVEELSRELDARPSTEVVLASRVKMLGRDIRRSGHRHLVGRAYATLASLVLRLPVYDTQCGAKLFRATPALRAALAEPFRSRWGFDVELLQRLQAERGDDGSHRIVEYPLRQWHDVGASKVSATAGARAFAQLLRLWIRRPDRRRAEGVRSPAGEGERADRTAPIRSP